MTTHNFGFDTPFAEQLAFFRQKLNLPSERWDDITRSAHDRGFIVAGAMKADLLTDLHASIDRALAGGGGLEAFRKDFPEIVKKHGWTGWTGEGTAGGVAWRTQVIYQTNMLTSYAAGRYRQLTDPDMLALRPYWRYKHADYVANPRLQHVAWNGLVLPHDHPFWRTHFPPNGWGCHCRVMSASHADYEHAQGAGKASPPAGWDQLDPKTGAPGGIAKGFDYAPGASWHPDLDRYPYPIARDLVADNLRDGVFERWHDRIAQLTAQELAKPGYAGLSKNETIARLRSALSLQETYPVAVLPPQIVEAMAVETQAIRLSSYDLAKQQVSRDGQDFQAIDYFNAQGTLDSAKLIVRENQQMTIFLSDAAGKWYAAVVQQTGTGKGLFLKSFRRSSEKDARLQRKKGTIMLDDLGE